MTIIFLFRVHDPLFRTRLWYNNTRERLCKNTSVRLNCLVSHFLNRQNLILVRRKLKGSWKSLGNCTQIDFTVFSLALVCLVWQKCGFICNVQSLLLDKTYVIRHGSRTCVYRKDWYLSENVYSWIARY